jgi:hypothetical protein
MSTIESKRISIVTIYINGRLRPWSKVSCCPGIVADERNHYTGFPVLFLYVAKIYRIGEFNVRHGATIFILRLK